MKNYLVIILCLGYLQSIGQVRHNRHDRLTKEEFGELLQYRDYFIPTDLKNDTVVIVRYSPARLAKQMNTARNISFARNGTDTTGLKNETRLTPKQIKRNQRKLDKFSMQYPEDLSKMLSKKGIRVVIVDEEQLASSEIYRTKYWLKTTCTSTQQFLEDNGWVLTYTNLFYDPRNGKDYEIFLPLNHGLLELIE